MERKIETHDSCYVFIKDGGVLCASFNYEDGANECAKYGQTIGTYAALVPFVRSRKK